MPFKLIAGTFQAVNYSPDGDSIRFRPNDVRLLDGLEGPRARVNTRGDVQLRIEGIDALETHYQPQQGGGALQQPREIADAARRRLLDFAGIAGVTWNAAGTSVVSAEDGTPGYVLTRAVEKNGRPVAFVFAGPPPEADGSDVFLRPERLEESYNHLALAEGLAYPTFYKGLFADLRAALAGAVERARAGGLGIHAVDATTAGFDVTSLASVTDEAVILPKLFRRIADYLVNVGSIAGFKERLAAVREPVLDLDTANFTHFDTFVEQEAGGTRIRLTRRPERLVFDEMPRQPTHLFARLLAGEAHVPAALD